MKITWRYCMAFLLLCLLLQEVHEIAHMLVDRFTVNCGKRFFLYWELCQEGGDKKVAIVAFAGPIVNFILLIAGYRMLSKQSTSTQKSIGFSLILATLPLQRLQAFIFRGSDEILGFRKLMQPTEPFKGAGLIAGLALILLFIVPALWRAYTHIKAKNSGLVMIGFLVVPFVFAYAAQQSLASVSARNILLTSPASFLPSWLNLLDIGLLLLFLPFRKSLAHLFSSETVQ